jgi:hypothetical protein
VSLAEYQIGCVVKAYLRNMATRATIAAEAGDSGPSEDRVTISQEALRTMFFGRIESTMTNRLRKREVSIAPDSADEAS